MYRDIQDMLGGMQWMSERKSGDYIVYILIVCCQFVYSTGTLLGRKRKLERMGKKIMCSINWDLDRKGIVCLEWKQHPWPVLSLIYCKVIIQNFQIGRQMDSLTTQDSMDLLYIIYLATSYFDFHFRLMTRTLSVWDWQWHAAPPPPFVSSLLLFH